MTSLMMSLGDIVDLSSSCSTLVVFVRDYLRLSLSIVSLFMTFIATTKSMKFLGTIISLMWTSTTIFLGCKDFWMMTFPRIILASCPMTLIVRVSIFLLGLLKNSSLMKLLYMGTSLFSYRRVLSTREGMSLSFILSYFL